MHALSIDGKIRTLEVGDKLTDKELLLSDQQKHRIESLSLQDRRSVYADGCRQRTLHGVRGCKGVNKFLRLRSRA